MYDPDRFIGDRLYFDANVFIYGIEGFEPYRAFLHDLFALIDDRAVHVATSEITLAEVLVVPLRENKSELVAVYLELFAPEGPLEILPVSRQILMKSAEIRANSSAKPIDAIHIATAMAVRSNVFISDDRRLNPAPVRKMTLEELAGG